MGEPTISNLLLSIVQEMREELNKIIDSYKKGYAAYSKKHPLKNRKIVDKLK